MTDQLQRYSKLLLLLLFLVLVQACGRSAAEELTPEEPIKLNVQLLPFMSFVPLYIAEEEGYFAEQGLEVEFHMVFAPDSFVALRQGDLDVAADFISASMLNLIGQDENIRMVAGKGYVAPTGCTVNGLIARKELVDAGELDNVAQLKGRTIAMDSVTVEGYYMDKLLSSAGLTLADVDMTDLPSPPAEMEAFESAAIDLSASSEPWVTRTNLAGNTVTWRSFQEQIPDFQFAVLLFGPTLLKDNPDVGQRFMTAYVKAMQQYNEGKTERNMELMMAFTELDQELLEQICWPTFREDGSINSQSVIDFQTWAVERELLEEIVPVDEFWEPSFVEYASEMLEE